MYSRGLRWNCIVYFRALRWLNYCSGARLPRLVPFVVISSSTDSPVLLSLLHIHKYLYQGDNKNVPTHHRDIYRHRSRPHLSLVSPAPIHPTTRLDNRPSPPCLLRRMGHRKTAQARNCALTMSLVEVIPLCSTRLRAPCFL